MQFAGSGGSFSIVAGEPTRHLRLAFHGGPDSLRDPDGNLVELVA